LRLKTYLLGGFALLATVVVIFVVSQTVLAPGIDRLEQAEIRRDMLRVQNAIEQNLADLAAAVRVYASSDQAVGRQGGRNHTELRPHLGDEPVQAPQAHPPPRGYNNRHELGGGG
jgi:hypothetical protein